LTEIINDFLTFQGDPVQESGLSRIEIDMLM